MTLIDRDSSVLWDSPRWLDSAASDASYLSPSEGEDEEWGRQIDRLLDIRRLRENWDGEGASAVNPLTVDSALELLRRHRDQRTFLPPSRIAAAGDGTVIIEWQSAAGDLWILEIAEPGCGEWMFVSADGQARHWVDSWSARRPDAVWS